MQRVLSRSVTIGILVLCVPAPTQAKALSLPAPLGLSLGCSLTQAQAALRAAKARWGTRPKTVKSPSGLVYKEARIKARLTEGPLAALKAFFVGDRLTRLTVFARDKKVPVDVEKLGKPHFVTGGYRVWVSKKTLQAIRCRRRSCDLIDRSVLIAAGFPADEVRKEFAKHFAPPRQAANKSKP